MTLRSLSGRQSLDPSLVNRLLLWLLVRADALLLALMQELQARARSPIDGLLRAAVARLASAAEATAGPDQLVPAVQLSEFLAVLEENPTRKSEALLTRLQILGTLGMAKPSQAARNGPAWSATPELKLMTPAMQVPLTRDGIETFLDQHFFASFLSTEKVAVVHQPTDRQILLLFVRAYEILRRPLGFTPGRPVALLACLVAAEEHYGLEVSDAYRCIYEAAQSKWSEFLHFSGGSRFDQEFLISVEPGFLSRLEEEATPDRRPTD